MLRWAVLLLAIAACALANTITVDGYTQRCFFEDLNQKDRITITWMVGGGASDSDLNLSFFVTAPDKNVFHRTESAPQGTMSTDAPIDGRYTYCWSNYGTTTPKTLTFNLHGVRAEDPSEPMAPVEREVRNLASAIELVRDEGEYLMIRERVHRNTCESTNARVKWWAIFQIFLLLALCGWNVRFIKSWFEVKRVL